MRKKRTFPTPWIGKIVTEGPCKGYRLPWSAYTGEVFLYADTLAGLKELVRRAKQK
jgi:hypothetical protein